MRRGSAIRRLPWLLTLFTLWPFVAAGAVPEVRILETDPGAGASLYRGDALYVRIGYRSEVPLRFSLRGFAGGTALEQVRTNPSPAYPEGAGEAIAWIERIHPGYMDELEIRVTGADWQPLQAFTVPLTLFWERETRPAGRVKAGWVDPLNAEQQAMARAPRDATPETGFGVWDLLILLMGWSVPGYFILQVYMGRCYRGGWRKAALAPLLGMVPLLAYTLIALVMGSNLWPLMLLFLAPVAFLYLAALGILHYLRGRTVPH